MIPRGTSNCLSIPIYAFVSTAAQQARSSPRGGPLVVFLRVMVTDALGLFRWRNTYDAQNAEYNAIKPYPYSCSGIRRSEIPGAFDHISQVTVQMPVPLMIIYCNVLKCMSWPRNRSSLGKASSRVSLYVETRNTRSPGISETRVVKRIRNRRLGH